MLWPGLFAVLALPAYGQKQELKQLRATPFYQLYRFGAGGGPARFEPAMPFTSMALSLAAPEWFEGISVVVEGDTLYFQPAAHQPDSAAGIVSELLVFDEPQEAIQLSGLPGKATGWLHFMYAPPLKIKTGPGFRIQEEPCKEPAAVQQSVWRNGLPEPDYTRSFNEITHLIVHHSATSNSAANYTRLVRNIYLYHTQTNGWSDIGYNYLIAPDGTLYAGRDPGATGAQDKVRGAHFCGKNSQTMGVCLLGNFMEVAPAPAALQKLERLLSWETYKESIDPLAIQPHPANPALPVIAGHRNGCATACPGDYLYALLPEVRQEVQEALVACAVPEGTAPFVFTDARAGEVCIGNMAGNEVEHIQLYTLQGKKLNPQAFRLEGTGLCWSFRGLAPGIYVLLAEGKGQRIRRKIFLL